MENTSVGRGRGNGIGRKINNVQSVEDCRAECWKVADCKFFIWNSPESRKQKLTCWLKRNSANSRSTNKDIGRISGPVTCNRDQDNESNDGTIDCSAFFLANTSVGTGGGGVNSAGKVLGVLTAENCRAECEKVPSCKFFLWHGPQAATEKLKCFLKKNNSNQRSGDEDIGKISGPVSC